MRAPTHAKREQSRSEERSPAPTEREHLQNRGHLPRAHGEGAPVNALRDLGNDFWSGQLLVLRQKACFSFTCFHHSKSSN